MSSTGSGSDRAMEMNEKSEDDSTLGSTPILEGNAPSSSPISGNGNGHGGPAGGGGGPPKGPGGHGGLGGPGGPGGRGGGPPPPHVLAKIGMKALARSGAILFVVIWCAGMWLFNSNTGSQNRVHHLKVLIRDFDESNFGQALIDAVDTLNGQDTHPTFIISTDATEDDMRDKVFDGTYWASISANSGSIAAFNESLTSSSTASTYNASSVYTYQAATVRYYTSYVSYVYPSILEILEMAESKSNEFAITLASGETSLTTEQLTVVANPTGYTFVDVAPLPFQSRVFLNTFEVVLSHLSQFFFNMAVNGIFLGVGIYKNTSFIKLIKRKYPIKIIWTLLTSISIASFPLIAKGNFGISAGDFFALWAVEWVYAMINFNTIATVLVFTPLPYVPLFVFPWVVTSLSSTISPIELSNVFYRISYVYPAHAYWNTMITIYGKGAVNTLRIYLPILAAWLVVTELAWLFGDITLAKRSTKPPSGRPGA